MNLTTPPQTTVDGGDGYSTFSIRTFTINTSISDYTGVQNAGSPPHSPSQNPQPRTSGGDA